MRQPLAVVLASCALLGAFPCPSKAGDEPSRRQAYNPYAVWNRSRPYSPAYGYSTGRVGNSFGNSAPYQGNIRFAPGFGYGSIYGNAGHPGFRTYRGPAWGNPAAWGR